jgi:DNA recombination protein RmuC
MSLTAIISFIIGCLAGGVITWLVVSSRARGAEAVNSELRQSIEKNDNELNTIRSERDSERLLNAKLEESHKHLKEDIHQFEEIEMKLVDKFKALSLDALSANSQEFIKLAEERLKSQTVAGEKELDNKKMLIDKNIEVIGQTLTEMQKKIDDVGKGSLEVSTLIKKHEEVTSKLKDTTDHLRQAFASSKKRGEWGERMAEDIIKLVGMVEGINYIKQKTLEDSNTRPDYTFLMPNNLKINMDVKFPLENYQHYLDAVTEHDRKRFKEELIKNAKVMIKQVTTRDYIDPSKNTVDYVIVFIPNEQVYSFINEADTTLMDEALKKKVVLCSPFTLYAILAVIRQGIENFNLEQTASEILKLLGDFSKQWNAWKDKFSVMGKRLDDARKEYDALLSTRSTMLERPLKKIDLLREQRDISFNSESMDDNVLPR